MSSDAKSRGSLRLGAAQVEITPWSNAHLAGSIAEYRPAKAVLDPLFVHALVLDNGRTKLCLISADLCVPTRSACNRIRDAAAKRHGFARDAVMLHLVQNHSAPALGNFMLDDDFKQVPPDAEWLRGSETPYTEFAIGKIGEAIDAAAARLEPAELGVTAASEGRLAFNRRGVARDGRVVMPGKRWGDPRGHVEFLHLEGPIDPQVLLMAFRTPALRFPAALLHYSCHPVNVFPRLLVSADWPGAWAEATRKLLGADSVPLVINGCCGNLNPWDPWVPEAPSDHVRMGQMLAKRCEDALDFMSYSSSDTLAFKSTHLRIPYRPVPADVLAQAKQYLADHPQIVWADKAKTQAEWKWYHAAMMVSLELEQRRERTMDYEVQAFRIGDHAVVGLPGEPFVEGQLRIKLDSPAPYTFVAHMTSHYVGYIPSLEAMRRGGHETTLSIWSKLAPEALDMIVERATGLLRELFPEGR